MAASAQPLPPSNPRPAQESAVARSIAKSRRNQTQNGSNPENEPISPLHSHDDIDEPPTPKAGCNLQLPAMENIGLDANEDLKNGTNPWMKVLQSAVDHDDEHVTKVVRSLYFAASHFDTSPPGYFTSSLPGSQMMDGSIFIRAAGLTLASLGWAHEGDKGILGSWDRSALGYDETWAEDELLPGARVPGSLKGKTRENSANSSRSNLSSFGGSGIGGGRPGSSSRSQPGSIMSPRDEEAGHFGGAGDAALLSPRLAHVNGFVTGGSPRGSPRASAEFSRKSQEQERVGWRKVGEELTPEELAEEEAQRRREEEERELMA